MPERSGASWDSHLIASLADKVFVFRYSANPHKFWHWDRFGIMRDQGSQKLWKGVGFACVDGEQITHVRLVGEHPTQKETGDVGQNSQKKMRVKVWGNLKLGDI